MSRRKISSQSLSELANYLWAVANFPCCTAVMLLICHRLCDLMTPETNAYFRFGAPAGLHALAHHVSGKRSDCDFANGQKTRDAMPHGAIKNDFAHLSWSLLRLFGPKFLIKEEKYRIQTTLYAPSRNDALKGEVYHKARAGKLLFVTCARNGFGVIACP